MEKEILSSPNFKKTPPKLDWKHGKYFIQKAQAKNRNWNLKGTDINRWLVAS